MNHLKLKDARNESTLKHSYYHSLKICDGTQHTTVQCLTKHLNHQQTTEIQQGLLLMKSTFSLYFTIAAVVNKLFIAFTFKHKQLLI